MSPPRSLRGLMVGAACACLSPDWRGILAGCLVGGAFLITDDIA